MPEAPPNADRCRLYLITPPRIPDLAEFNERFRASLEGGDVACLQLRLKAPDGGPPGDDEVKRAVDALLPAARDENVALLINDSPELAKACGADGVHIGQSDATCREARSLLGDDASIGVTCHASIDLAFRAGEDGADYVAFGAFFPTRTKAAPTRADPEILSRWSEATVLACVAIGGITPANAAPLVAAGADFLAVSSAVWSDAKGPAHAVAAFNRVINEALDERPAPRSIPKPANQR